MVRPVWSGETDVVYDGKEHSLTATVSVDLGNGTKQQLAVYYDNNSFVNAGEHTVTVYLEDTKNYEFPQNSAFYTKTLNIRQQAVTITWDDVSEVEYDGKYYSRKATIRGAADNKELSGFSYVNSQSYRDAGTYTYEIYDLNNDNYTLYGVTNKTATLNIKKQRVEIVWSGNEVYTYTGEKHTMTASVKGLIDGEDLSGYYELNSVKEFYNAGEYTATIANFNHKNYTIEGCIGDLSATAVINRIDVTIVWSNTEFIYDGLSHTVTATVTDSYGNVIDEYSYYNTTRYTNTATAVGDYTARLRFNNSTNYNIVSGNTYCSWSIVQ